MKNRQLISIISILILLFLVIGGVTASENITKDQTADKSPILKTNNNEEKITAENSEFLQYPEENSELNNENSNVLGIQKESAKNSNFEVLKAPTKVEVLNSYNTYYDFDCEYDSSVKECNHYYTFYTQHHGKVTLEVDAKDVKKLAIANANKKYKVITYETIKKHKVTIKHTKTFKRTFKEMGHTVKLNNKQWNKEKAKVNKLLKKGWKITKKTKNEIKIVKKEQKKTKIYFDLVNYPKGNKYWWTGYNTQYVRIYTDYYPYLDEDIAAVCW